MNMVMASVHGDACLGSLLLEPLVHPAEELLVQLVRLLDLGRGSRF